MSSDSPPHADAPTRTSNLQSCLRNGCSSRALNLRWPVELAEETRTKASSSTEAHFGSVASGVEAANSSSAVIGKGLRDIVVLI
ncbi:Protein of unknown function [Gryllus bimaculatus]|nr:Protein of unknown function [Gryllus bimaculatus]